jgi:hypothetical protein
MKLSLPFDDKYLTPYQLLWREDTSRLRICVKSRQIGMTYVDIRNACIVSLSSRLGTWRDRGRITYTGGYVLPGTSPGAGQTALPDDLEQAAVEQVAYWFRNKDTLGLIRNWPSGGTYQVFLKTELLPNVSATLSNYERYVL